MKAMLIKICESELKGVNFRWNLFCFAVMFITAALLGKLPVLTSFAISFVMTLFIMTGSYLLDKVNPKKE